MGNFSKQKDNNERRKLGTLGGKREHHKQKIWVNIMGFPSLPEFSKLCLMVKARILTLSDVTLNVCRRFKTIINREGRIKRFKVFILHLNWYNDDTNDDCHKLCIYGVVP